ncbi:uncharacterized protein FOMMEDRAFT_93074, partial [Fomitiporia mediterranea MF3/22]|uniref:uncharacterized protein n=1 Tax=Fomitiporia mediterranea (strain MF3/22) TaxID=694068 RepID=UPI000440900D
VAMAVEETLHYPIEGPIALHDWASNKPVGAGFVRLGPNRRMFSISMAHQLHCLRIIRAALINETPTAFQHSHHCLNYIRQMTLCNPDLTLERFDPLDRDFEVDRVGATHVCKDWTAVYTAFSENLADFKQYVNEL